MKPTIVKFKTGQHLKFNWNGFAIEGDFISYNENDKSISIKITYKEVNIKAENIKIHERFLITENNNSNTMKKKAKKGPAVVLSKHDKAELKIKENEKKAKLNKPKKVGAKKSVKHVFKDTEDVILISVDRNWLARRSHELNEIISKNNLKDPKLLDGNILSETLKCQGANEQILEILDKYENI